MAATPSRTEGLRPNLSAVVAQRVRDMILSGRLRPGERLDQDALAEEIGVSRMPLREAFIALEAEGLISLPARQGAYVASLTRDDFRDHYAVFGRVCGLAAERAAFRQDEALVEHLTGIVDAMRSAASAEEHHVLNNRFHEAINRAGASKRLRAVIRFLSNSMPTRYYEFDSEPHWRDDANQEHQSIADAIRDGDGQRAATETAAHFSKAAEHTIRDLESIGFWSNGAARVGDAESRAIRSDKGNSAR